jgi:hypothetical protein
MINDLSSQLPACLLLQPLWQPLLHAYKKVCLVCASSSAAAVPALTSFWGDTLQDL